LVETAFQTLEDESDENVIFDVPGCVHSLGNNQQHNQEPERENPQPSFQNAPHQYVTFNTHEPSALVSNPLDALTKAITFAIKATGKKQQPEVYMSKFMARQSIGKVLPTFADEPEQLANVSFRCHKECGNVWI